MKKHIWTISTLGFLLYLAAALTNIGIIATDDYEFGIARIVPAQNWTFESVIEASGIRSPFPNLVLFVFTSFAYKLGVLDPVLQLKFALTFIAILCFSLHCFFGYRLFADQGEKEKGGLFVFLMSFFFVCPLLYTRPLIETLSSPFVTVSAYFAFRYWRGNRQIELTLSLLALMLAAMFRYQTGVCAVALLLLVLWKKDWLGMGNLIVTGAIAYIFSGSLDWVYKGSLHASLFSYTRYQMSEISKFGKQPFYVFIALFLGLTFPPVLLHRYRNFDWKKTYTPFVPLILFFLVFLISHSLVVHKEERFMIPILPVFFALLVPLTYYTSIECAPWRKYYFLVVNFLLLPLASFNVPQNNLIGVARFMHKHPEIHSVTEVGETLFNFPKAYISHPVQKLSFSPEEVSSGKALSCQNVLALRQDVREGIPNITEHYKKIAEFKPGVLEQLVIWLNPRQNKRRGPIEVYAEKSC
jgi:hypothetical protein